MASSACADAFRRSDAAGESMRHPHPDIKPGIGSGGNGTLDIAARIIEQDFVVADVNADGRQPGKLPVERRSQRKFGSALPK